MPGSLWKPLGTSENVWEPVATSGSFWEHLGASGNLWDNNKELKDNGTGAASKKHAHVHISVQQLSVRGIRYVNVVQCNQSQRFYFAIVVRIITLRSMPLIISDTI